MVLLLLFLLALVQQSHSAIKTSAVYTLSNSATGNQVYVYKVDPSTGSATYDHAVDANGVGADDTSHSQGALVTCGNYLLGCNNGESTISSFWIDSNDATNITRIATQTIMGTGSKPTTIAATNAWGNVACVVTSFGQLSLSCYSFNETGMYYMSAWTRDLGITVSAGGSPVSQASFSTQNSFLVIQFRGNPTGALIYTIQNGVLAANPVTVPAQAPLGPRSYGFIFLRDNTIVTTDATDVVGIVLYTIMANGSIGDMNDTITPANTSAYCWMVYSPLTKHAYAISAFGNVTEVAIASNNALSLGAEEMYTTSLTDGTIVSATGMDWLYIVGTQGITLWKITGASKIMYESTAAYPAGLPSGTCGGLASATFNESGASLAKGSILIFAIAILLSLANL